MLGIGSAAWHKHLDSNMERALAVFHVVAVVCSLSGSWLGNEGRSPTLISDPSNTCSSWPKVRTRISLDQMLLYIIRGGWAALEDSSLGGFDHLCQRDTKICQHLQLQEEDIYLP